MELVGDAPGRCIGMPSTTYCPIDALSDHYRPSQDPVNKCKDRFRQQLQQDPPLWSIDELLQQGARDNWVTREDPASLAGGQWDGRTR